MKSEPVLIVVLVAVLTELGGAVTAFASNMTTVGALLAAGTFLTGVGGAVARSLVSPVSRGLSSGGQVRQYERY
jgi:hypothetical protein